MDSLKFSAAALLAFLLAACGVGGESDGHGGHGDEGEAHGDATETVRGEHGGRLLSQHGLTVELGIAEDGRPPAWQAWLYLDGEPQPATAGSVSVSLVRLGGVREEHVLQAQADGSLLADTVVEEPHSFDVTVRAQAGGRTAQWSYPSYEGRTRIEASVAELAGIRTAPAGPGIIDDQHELQGLLTPVESRVARVGARFPGRIRTLDAEVGDAVVAGRRLAMIESNLSLSDYAVQTPIAGVVLARRAAVGAVVAEGEPLFEIADLSTLWVDLHVFGGDAQHIGPGAPVRVTRLADGRTAETTLERVLPGTATASQSTVVRASLPNDDGLWRPGAAVRARVTVSRQEVPLAVPLAALQHFRDWTVVFVRVGDTYEVRPVETGRRDAHAAEILSGIRPGDELVVEQSYLVKADIEKSGASHDH